MINAGAIATAAMVAGHDPHTKLERILTAFARYTGHLLTVDQDVFRSEKETGHRNRAIAHLLRGFGILDDPPEGILDVYFRQCSINVTCRDLAVMGACLANNGVNPITAVRALKTEYVPKVLSVMGTCGMYDYSGNWVYTVGMPAKSGVGGGIIAVLPGQLGLAVFSPRLDERGNSARGIKVCDLVNFFEQEAGKILVDFATPSWMTFTEGFRNNAASKTSKRAFDICASFILLMFSWPIMLVTAIAIWLEDGFGAPVFFRQERVGLHGRVFRVLKFRSMTVDAEGDGKARWATKNDSRVTRVGSFIRKTRIDELPQIINVLAGDMAFIGPRPERPEFVKELAAHIPYYNARHCVKPGITGWAQVSGRNALTWEEKFALDVWYVDHVSLGLDLRILWRTVRAVVAREGISAAGHETMPEFRGAA